MLTLDSTTLFFYSRIVSNNDKSGPPSKKRKAERDPITAWIDHVQPNAPSPSRAASSSSKNTSWTVTSSRPPPSLMARSTHSSNSTLTNTIRITQNPQLPTTAVKKEPKKARIDVEDNGVFSDCDEMEGQERERALASGVKHGVRVTSSVSHLLIFSLTLGLPLLARIWSPRTHRSLLCLPPKPQSHSKKLAFPRGSTTSSSSTPSFLPLSHIWVVKEILGIVQHPSCVAKFVLSLDIQAKLTLRSTLRVLFTRMWVLALLNPILAHALHR